jgi:hypothetical protein
VPPDLIAAVVEDGGDGVAPGLNSFANYGTTMLNT